MKLLKMILMHVSSHNSPTIVSKLMDDPDSDVIMRMLQVLYAFWKLHLHESAQQKRTRIEDVDTAMTIESQPIFFMIKGDHWIIEAVCCLG